MPTYTSVTGMENGSHSAVKYTIFSSGCMSAMPGSPSLSNMSVGNYAADCILRAHDGDRVAYGILLRVIILPLNKHFARAFGQAAIYIQPVESGIE